MTLVLYGAVVIPMFWGKFAKSASILLIYEEGKGKLIITMSKGRGIYQAFVCVCVCVCVCVSKARSSWSFQARGFGLVFFSNPHKGWAMREKFRIWFCAYPANLRKPCSWHFVWILGSSGCHEAHLHFVQLLSWNQAPNNKLGFEQNCCFSLETLSLRG